MVSDLGISSFISISPNSYQDISNSCKLKKKDFNSYPIEIVLCQKTGTLITNYFTNNSIYISLK